MRSLDALVIGVALCGCSGRSVPPSPPSNTAEATAAKPAGPPCEDMFPDVDLVSGNMHASHMSGVAEILEAATFDEDGTSPAKATQGYVNFRYKVRVLRYYAGQGPEALELAQMADAGIKPRQPGTLLLFSACNGDKPGLAYEPDTAYFIPASAACRDQLEQLATESAAVPRPADASNACSN